MAYLAVPAYQAASWVSGKSTVHLLKQTSHTYASLSVSNTTYLQNSKYDLVLEALQYISDLLISSLGPNGATRKILLPWGHWRPKVSSKCIWHIESQVLVSNCA